MDVRRDIKLQCSSISDLSKIPNNPTANLGFKWNYPIPPIADKPNIRIKDNQDRKSSKHIQKMFQSRQIWSDWKTQTVFEEQQQRQKKQMMRSREAPALDLSSQK